MRSCAVTTVALAAWRRFVSCVKALPAEQAAPVWLAVRSEEAYRRQVAPGLADCMLQGKRRGRTSGTLPIKPYERQFWRYWPRSPFFGGSLPAERRPTRPAKHRSTLQIFNGAHRVLPNIAVRAPATMSCHFMTPLSSRVEQPAALTWWQPALPRRAEPKRVRAPT
jgi:hypothetical protein